MLISQTLMFGFTVTAAKTVPFLMNHVEP